MIIIIYEWSMIISTWLGYFQKEDNNDNIYQPQSIWYRIGAVVSDIKYVIPLIMFASRMHDPIMSNSLIK